MSRALLRPGAADALRRWSLWMLLVALVAGMLVTLVWLAGRYEASQVQVQLERDTQAAVADVRKAFARNLQSLQALHALHAHQPNMPAVPDVSAWQARAMQLLDARRELVRIEWRDARMRVRAHVETPYRPLLWDNEGRSGTHADIALTCANAQRTGGAVYAGSYFQPMPDGSGGEMLEMCFPLGPQEGQRSQGFVVATYALHTVLLELVAPQVQRTHEVSFPEADGTRLALASTVNNNTRRGTRLFTAQHLFDLPGTTLVLRMDYRHTAPSVFPNVLTALVTGMSIALIVVLVVLVRDNRRRLSAERELGETLAFRKAMEDSLITGLRARNISGRITYVNPAFCAMVGFASDELVGCTIAPYWPPEHAQGYAQRQMVRMSGALPPPREGYESTFMHRDGTRFAVMIYEAPLINAHGQHTGWMGSFLDVSEQRRVEEISRASQERLQATARLAMVGEMASLLSHELNQPLVAIASYASGSLNLLDCSAQPPEQPHMQEVRLAIQRIATQAERAGRVIKSVHDFVRRRERSRECIAVQAIFDAVLPIIRMQARKLNVSVVLDLEGNLPQLLCDRTMLEQVLLNLTRNAMQAMDAPHIHPRTLELRVCHMHTHTYGTCRSAAATALQTPLGETPHSGALHGAREAGRLVFSVTDVGTGISEEVAACLFTPFYTTRAEGMGLGLSLCRTVVEQHGGTLEYARHLPRGTVFTFTLPAA